jgi:hypothetical protein
MEESKKKLPQVILTQENLEKKYKHHLTIKDLKKMIEDMPDDGLVLVQRIQDIYFENHHWGVILKEGEHYFNAKKFNEDLVSGEYEDKKKYPKAKPEEWKSYSEEELDLAKEQYHPAWCVVKYKDDPNNLYLDLHY